MKPFSNILRKIAHVLFVLVGSVALTLLLFLVLPLMQTIAQTSDDALALQAVETADTPPPPPPPEPEEEKKEEKTEEEPPKLAEESEPLDLSQLEMALNPTVGEGWFAGDFAVKLPTTAEAQGDQADALFSLADLDQRPRVLYQPSPNITDAMRRKAPGTVYVIFIVDERGRVDSPSVQKSTDPVFDAPALSAVKQWKFEPGKRNGQAVRFRMRVPITIPKGS